MAEIIQIRDYQPKLKDVYARFAERLLEQQQLLDYQALVRTEGDCWPWKQEDGGTHPQG